MRKLTYFVAGLGLAFTIAAPALAQDADAGAKVFNRCKACHKVGEGAKNGIGPELNGVFGEKPGAVEGYTFSNAFQEWAADKPEWNDELMTTAAQQPEMDQMTTWLTDPRGTVKGTKMAFPGLKKEEDLQNVIAYLKTFNEDGSQAQ